ncbi:MAG: hypothetical protein II942_00130 [Alphaproteobacteria bacterium]|nr:hypothetical protein [Alphaproteobacteria bacterium]
MILLKTLMGQLRLRDALFFGGAPVNRVQSVSIALVRGGYPRIPRGYLNFLGYSDGLVWNGIELFSCSVHERAGTVFTQQDLLSYQEKYGLKKVFSKYLILGRSTEILICYDSMGKSYVLLDRSSLQTILKFPRFEDLLYHLIY